MFTTISNYMESRVKTSLKLQWTIVAAVFLAVLLACTFWVISNAQHNKLKANTIDAGISFAKFVAIETAVPLLSEDWITLETFISEALNQETFSYIMVIDRDNIIRGANDIDLVGESYVPQATLSATSQDDVKASLLELEGQDAILNLQTPIYFQNIEVGKIAVGLPQPQYLNTVNSATSFLTVIWLMLTLLLSVLVFLLGKHVSSYLKKLEQAILNIKSELPSQHLASPQSVETNNVYQALVSAKTLFKHVSEEKSCTPPIARPSENNQQKVPGAVAPEIQKQDTVKNGNIDTPSEDSDKTIVTTVLDKGNGERAEQGTVDIQDEDHTVIKTDDKAGQDTVDIQDEDHTVIKADDKAEQGTANVQDDDHTVIKSGDASDFDEDDKTKIVNKTDA